MRINYYLTAVTALPKSTRWEPLARLALREELYAALRAVVLDVLTERGDEQTPVVSLDRWALANRARLTRAERLLSELPSLTDESVNLATLSVVVRRIRSIIRTPEPQV